MKALIFTFAALTLLCSTQAMAKQTGGAKRELGLRAKVIATEIHETGGRKVREKREGGLFKRFFNHRGSEDPALSRKKSDCPTRTAASVSREGDSAPRAFKFNPFKRNQDGTNQ